MVRYFEAPAEDQKQARFVCKRCGAESEHRTNECPIQICLTCGARDEHSTRSCPISKTCFTCGMKGHINKNCPNRHSRDRMNNFYDCDRCGSEKHNTNVWSNSPGYNGAIRPDLRSRNALPSGGCTNMLLTASAWIFSNFVNRNCHLLLARVVRATSQTTSGATTAETADTSVT
jgi:ribosomal protein L40E